MKEKIRPAATPEELKKPGVKTEYLKEKVKTDEVIKGKKKVHIPQEPPWSNEKMVGRWMQMCHNYFELWVDVIRRHFGEEKLTELINEWGAVQGIYSGKLYRDVMLKNNMDPTNILDYAKVVNKSRVLMQETGDYWLLDDDAVLFQTFVCPTGQMFKDLGLARNCVTQCDKWFERNLDFVGGKWRLVRTRNYVDDDFCEWILYTKK